MGLDGVGLELARSLAARGVMPHLGRLLELGTAWPTTAPLPEVSPVCWTTMFSGADPGSTASSALAGTGQGPTR